MFFLSLGTGQPALAQLDAQGLSLAHQEQVDRRLNPPPDEVQRYGSL
jgi:hypothetical protein